ncbi:YdcF family protein [Bacillus sp. FJAT-45350]|uniref:YdcF family protein n=1 Tax=Bacillus sp. FJAT-45350 TaxID=2011014 RepID=UPI000BB99098|nr:YdcF family protein [Bacillus sp. FJAT-45350]
MLKKKFIGISIIIFSAFYICFAAISIWSYSFENQLVKSDAAIVLGAAVWGNEPSPVLRERINHSIWLYDNGYVNKLIFTGGKGDGYEYAESEVAKAYAIENNVDVDDIFIETESSITEENLKYASEIALENNLHTLIIVSDPLHMKRAIVIAESIGMKVHSSPTPSSAYQTLKSKVPFFLRELFFYIGHVVTSPFRA